MQHNKLHQLSDCIGVPVRTRTTPTPVRAGEPLRRAFGRSQGFDLSTLKLPASYISQVVAQFPVFSPSDSVSTSNGADSFVQFQPRNVWAVLGSLFHQKGRHALKIGGDIRLLHFNEGQNSNASGNFSFSRLFTQGPNPTQASTNGGNGVASLLLGDASGGSLIRINPISTQSTYYALYFQDDWRVNSRLTLNLGLRWDVGVGDRGKSTTGWRISIPTWRVPWPQEPGCLV